MLAIMVLAVIKVENVNTSLLPPSLFSPSLPPPPVVSYACNFNSDDSSCHPSIPIVNIVIGVLLALDGLFLCFLAHRFFHVGTSTEILLLPPTSLTDISSSTPKWGPLIGQLIAKYGLLLKIS